MALDFDSLQQVDIKTKYLINGFIRHIQCSNISIYKIPELIILTSLSFYHEPNIFFKCGKSMTILNKGKTVTYTPNKITFLNIDANACYCSKWIDVSSNTIAEFKVNSINGFAKMYIGICASDNIINRVGHGTMYADNGYIIVDGKKGGWKGKGYKRNDIVTLKMQNKCIEFIVNGLSQHKCENLQHEKYKLAVSMWETAAQVTLLKVVNHP
eukprot:358830_1